MGVEIKQVYLTTGEDDLLVIVDAPTETTSQNLQFSRVCLPTLSETVAIKRALESIERAAAKQRQGMSASTALASFAGWWPRRATTEKVPGVIHGKGAAKF